MWIKWGPNGKRESIGQQPNAQMSLLSLDAWVKNWAPELEPIDISSDDNAAEPMPMLQLGESIAKAAAETSM